ncbi:TPA: cation diffusion facilitator family transporter [Legionella pneumophila]|nr:cation diffusion facilitator family transporter [Legionella pneumophila]HAT9742094.1 cation diffusion facilitator family transporter [Legionella pneumophila subsp. pneumophila]HAT8316964.1 cation diffusion facilitator family transporter [Legionella pneumophila]HAT8370188.1 cation diffusion facilitator family transporter [Legionella pneumophila]HBD9291347.1 cation diffusion facilitator family transporter [Legionella pneumophila]
MTIQKGLHERRALKISIAVTFLLAVVGILFGLLSGSLAIVFDGMFNMVDTVISILAFFVARLLTSKGNRRFQYGYWHIEPMVLVLNGSILILLCTYALVNAIGSLMSGGHELNFDWAFVFALLVFFLSTGMYFYLVKTNRKIKSEFLRLDIQSWLMSALISTSLLLAFGIAALLHGGTYGYFTPYIDPLILAILTAFLIFVPMAAVRDAMRDIFRMAPVGLDERIRKFLDELIKQHDFKTYTSYVAKIGRAQFIEIHIVVPMDYPISSIETLDKIRNEIALAIGEDTPQRWLTIAFTANENWI